MECRAGGSRQHGSAADAACPAEEAEQRANTQQSQNEQLTLTLHQSLAMREPPRDAASTRSQ